MPFNLNTIILLPLLRAILPAGGVSVFSTLLAMTGLDGGIMGLGHPETAADDLVAWMMSFSVAAPVFWAWYVAQHTWTWVRAVLRPSAPPES